MVLYQCLLFITPKIASKNPLEIVQQLEQNNVKAFALLHSSAFKDCPQRRTLFTRHNIEILNNQLSLSLQRALEHDQVEIVEIIVQDFGKASSWASKAPPYFCISVETGNDIIARWLFGRDAAVYFGNFLSSKINKVTSKQNLKLIERILKIKADINNRNVFAGTLLHLAVSRKDETMVKMLLKHNANINAEMSDLSTPLHLAACGRHETIMNLLLENGANIDARKKDGSTVLLLAVDCEEIETVRLLLKGGADLNVGKYDGLTPLHLAVKNGNIEIVNELLNQGAIVNATMAYCHAGGITPLCFATEEKNLKIAKRLVESGADANVTYGDQTILRLAVSKGHLESVKFLVEHGADVNTPIFGGQTILRLAVEKGCLNLTKLLLQCGADVNASCYGSQSILGLAVDRGYSEIVEQLLDHGAHVNAPSDQTILQRAVDKGYSKIVNCLLEHCADVNVLSNSGQTMLQHAVDKGYLKITKYLLERGIDVNTPSHGGHTVLGLAVNRGDLEMVKHLLACGADVNSTIYGDKTALRVAFDRGYSEIVMHLLEFGADVNAPSYDGQTVLKLAVDQGDLKIIEFVLEHRPDLSNEIGNRRLFYFGCQDGEKADNIMKMLLQYGCTINKENINNSTLFHIAICKNYIKIVQQFLDCGFDVNMTYWYFDLNKCCSKKTMPLITAIRFSEENMIQLLVKYGADVNATFYLDFFEVWCPLKEALLSKNLKILEVLLAYEVNLNFYNGLEDLEEVLHFAIESKCVTLVEDFLKKGLNVNGNRGLRCTPMTTAAAKSSREIVQLLLKFGANVDSRDEFGLTALHVVSFGADDKLDIVKCLIQNNADVEARCLRKEKTPIFLAVSKRRLKIVDELLKFGAKIDYKDNSDLSPLHYAVIHGSSKIFRALLDFSFTNADFVQKTDICKLFSRSYLVRVKWLRKQFVKFEACFRQCAEILARHVIKRKAVFSDSYLHGNLIVSDDEYVANTFTDLLPFWYKVEDKRNDFLVNCKTEVAKLKIQFLGSTNVSFYDILTKNVKQLSCYLRNPCIVQTLKSKDYKTKLPIYSSVIFYQLRKGAQRRNLLNRAMKSFHRLFRQFNRLPRNVKEELLNYLSNRDLEVLIYACLQTEG